MKDKLTKYILLCLLVCIGTGCEQTEMPGNANIGKEVNVRFSLGMLPAEGTGTRASAPHVPEVENLIYDIWVLQFNKNGILLDTETKYYPRKGESGLYVEDFEATLIAAQNSTVCLVVNTNDPTISWPNNFPAFQRMLLDVQASNDLSRRDRMPMCGYAHVRILARQCYRRRSEAFGIAVPHDDSYQFSGKQSDRCCIGRRNRCIGKCAYKGIRLSAYQSGSIAL